MPTAEIVSIGTELLLGDVLDTNSQFFAVELAKLGIDSYFRSTVGDNKDRIKAVLKAAFDRSDIVITSGGLGPTADDLTTECIAELFQVPMIMDESIVRRVEKFFRLRGVPMPESNRKQGLRPDGAQWLPNPTGTAPGIIWTISKELLKQAKIKSPGNPRTILTFPGIPGELKIMWEKTAIPFLQQQFVQGTLWSVELKHYGIGESTLAEKYDHLLKLSNPTVAPYAGRGECRLRVTARGDTVSDAMAIAAPVIEEIKNSSGLLCYGTDKDTLESLDAAMLSQRNLTLSTAESCTGGLVSKRLTDVAGSSKYTRLNVVTYSNDAKSDFLKVPERVLAEPGAVSSECAQAMARGVRRLAKTDIGVSLTGIAGTDGGTDEKPVGLVYIGLAADQFCAVKELKFSGMLTRAEIRFRSANEALNMVRLYLLDPNNFENINEAAELKVDYRMTITRGIAPQFKRCQLNPKDMPVEDADKLRQLLEGSGVLNVHEAFVERAGTLVTWVLIVDDGNGRHQISSHAGEVVGLGTELDVVELLDFLNPYLDEWDLSE